MVQSPVDVDSSRLGEEETVIYEITNNGQVAKRTLKKTVVNGNGGEDLAVAWTLTATDGANDTPINGIGTVVPNSDDLMATISSDVTANVEYTLSEPGPSGYSATLYECTVTDAYVM